MEWLDRLNQAVDYLENNLEGEIDYHEAARIACCSTFHFTRMFSYIAGMPLSEYVRRRRMTCAALKIQRGEAKVIELALAYGYESPTAFSRAFASVHGVTPSAARHKGTVLKAYPRLKFLITIKGDTEMNYKIVHKDAFRIVGVVRHYNWNLDECFGEVPKFWAETTTSGQFAQICALCGPGAAGIMGVSTCMNGKDFDYYIACETDAEVPEGMTEHIVPSCDWAIFACVGPMPDAIQKLQKRIVSEWLPASGYEYANAPDIELYSAGDVTAADYRAEVWLPVVKTH